MKKLFVVLGTSLSLSSVFAQSPLKNAVQAFSYSVVSESGTNACAVTYNAGNELYYTGFAGNEDYPLEAFNSKGENKYAGEMGFDSRGLWYSKKNNILEGIGYPQKGKSTITLDASGRPISLKQNISDAPSIPNPQSIATYDGKSTLYLFDGKSVYVLNASNLKRKSEILPLSIPGDMANLNYTTVVFTGVKGYELAFYDSFEAKVYFTNLKGVYAGTSKLPDTAPEASAFRLSYANNLLWIYDADTRTWFSYRVF